jgi:hypothetical protein
MQTEPFKPPPSVTRFQSFDEFYPFYLSQHAKASTRGIHFIGTTCGIIALIAAFLMKTWWVFPAALLAVYGLLFCSHFVFEKNRPATFKNPVWSFRADLKMWFEILKRGRL